ncbi:MAG TPA: SIS domain-containing protein [Symbiobacteriaceae bacterium]|nr:SIS domain-containing protein [Symbiobacteriaceae bacterium]
MSVSLEALFAQALERVEILRATQSGAIRNAAELLAGRLRMGGVVHIFGTGHSVAFAMELAGRAGGLVPMNIIALTDVCSRGGRPWSLLADPALERDPQWAHELLALHHIEPADAFIVVSNSGRNGSTVEMALEAKRRGLPLVIVTSLAHSREVTSRHPSGLRLFEIGDVVIDNCGPYGDALLGDPRLAGSVCSVSSITGGFIAQSLTAEITRLMLEQGEAPPVLISANVDGADEHNQRVRQGYGNRISW